MAVVVAVVRAVAAAVTAKIVAATLVAATLVPPEGMVMVAVVRAVATAVRVLPENKSDGRCCGRFFVANNRLCSSALCSNDRQKDIPTRRSLRTTGNGEHTRPHLQLPGDHDSCVQHNQCH